MKNIFYILLIFMVQPLTAQTYPQVVSHRGGSLFAPENTLAAIDLSLQAGVDCIEIDVQLSADNVVVVIHDETLDRTTTGKGKIASMKFSQIREADAGVDFSDAFQGEKVPALYEILERVGGKAMLLIEIKNPGNIYQGIEVQIAEIIHKYNASSWCVIQSFNPDDLYRMHQADPLIKLGLLRVFPGLRKLKKDKELLPILSEINVYYRFASRINVRKIQKMGKKVRVWTVNSEHYMKQMIRNNVDGIITDDPLLLLETLKKQ